MELIPSNNSKQVASNKPQILIESQEDSESESSDSYAFHFAKPANPNGQRMIKYKSVGNSRNRIGSEDIMLGTLHYSGKDTRAPNNEGSSFNLKKAEESNTSLSVAKFGIGSFEKYEYRP